MDRDQLEQAYRATTYSAQYGNECIPLRVGEKSARFDALLAAHGATQWAFITAYNPHSEPQPDDENRARQASLTTALHTEGWMTLACQARADDDQWPTEEGVVILAIDKARARTIARTFAQYAILHGQRGEAPALVFVDD